jgi:hypothetical protein
MVRTGPEEQALASRSSMKSSSRSLAAVREHWPPAASAVVVGALAIAALAIVSEWLPSGATVTAIREAVYFHGNQNVLPFAVLAVWAATWLGAMLVVSHRRGTSPGIP